VDRPTFLGVGSGGRLVGRSVTKGKSLGGLSLGIGCHGPRWVVPVRKFEAVELSD
jgi:hypothetical protein